MNKKILFYAIPIVGVIIGGFYFVKAMKHNNKVLEEVSSEPNMTGVIPIVPVAPESSNQVVPNNP